MTELTSAIDEITVIHGISVDVYQNTTEMFSSAKSYLFDVASSISEELESTIEALDSVALTVSDELNDLHSRTIDNINQLEEDIK